MIGITVRDGPEFERQDYGRHGRDRVPILGDYLPISVVGFRKEGRACDDNGDPDS